MACAVLSPTSMPTITICQPRPARLLLQPDPQFFRRYISPAMGATFDSEGDPHTRNLSYNDTQAMTVQTHKASRRREIPSWALNPSTLQLVLVTYWEARAFGLRQQKEVNTNHSLQDRLKRAQKTLEKHAKNQILPMLDYYCQCFTECADPRKRARWAQKIRATDMSLRVIQRGPGLCLRILNACYNRGLSSVGAAEECHVSAVLVRQILFRTNRTWRRICSESERRV